MAKFVLTDASVTINSVDLSDHVASVTLDITADEIEETAFGQTFKSRLGGLWPLLGTVTTFEIKPTSDAVSSTNPKYSGSVLVNQHQPVANGVGELASFSVSFPTSGTITRSTS